MILAIRIAGQIGLKSSVKETLYRLRLRRKYSAIILEGTEKEIGMLETVRNCIAYGKITEETRKKLVEARGQKDKEGKMKKFFRLHPPRGGAKTKFHYPKGILGKNKDIEKLLEKML